MRLWFSTASNGAPIINPEVVLKELSDFVDMLIEEGKSNEQLCDNAQFIIDIFQGKEKISRRVEFSEQDEKEIEKNIVKIEKYLSTIPENKSYNLAA